MASDVITALVSIVTPVYRPGNDLLDLGLAIEAQTYREFEWIVVDDGSGEAYSEVFDRLTALGIERLQVVRLTENVGQARARNVGLQHSKGSFIKFVDADDLLDAHHLQSLLEVSLGFGQKARIAFAPTRHLFAATGESHVNRSYVSISALPEEQLARLLEAPFLSHCGALFPVQLLRDLGGYDPSLTTDEDGDLLIRVLLSDWAFVAAPECNYIYRHGNTSERVSIDDGIAKFEARRRVCLKVTEHYRSLGVTVPAKISASLCRRIDAIAVRAFRKHSDFSRGMFELAASVLSSRSRSGSVPERVIRRLFGISVMLGFKELYAKFRR